ncbi:MAG TPA: hypothetical protein VF742_00860, partial [Terracidiphilus sp.]
MATFYLFRTLRHNPKPYRSLAWQLALLCAAFPLAAQTPSSTPPAPSAPVLPVPSVARFVVVLDAAHGGDDTGGKLNDNQDEKAVD